MRTLDPMTDATGYDEFSYFADNAAEVGVSYPGPPLVRREFVEVAPGQSMSALVWGDGDPEFVFVHGGAQNAHTWDTTILAMGRPDAIAVDLPGHGHSDWRADRDYLPATNAAALATVVERLAPHARAVIGMSLGGLTSYVLAARRADLVRSLVVVDVTPGTKRENAARILDFVRGPSSFDSFDAILARTIEHNPGRSVSSLRRGVLHNARQLPDGRWAWRYDRVENPREVDLGSLWPEVEAIRCPLLLLIGGAWSVVDADDLARFRAVQPGATVTVVDGAGHSIQGDRPVELAALIRAFVDASVPTAQ
jgi:pimeloyl-ACP methyl ester carboxylesterase